jgi:hypothetical protein
MIFDYSMLTSEEFEFLVEDILKKKGFTIERRPGRGPDQGKDMIASRTLVDDMSLQTKERYLVECKNLAESGKSVKESDLGNFEGRMEVHDANRYLLATSTILSETVKNQLSAVNESDRKAVKCTFWVGKDMDELIMDDENISRKYFSKHSILPNDLKQLANYLHTHHNEAHRGAILYCPERTVVFGNDGYGSEDNLNDANRRSRNEVKLMREMVNELGIEELGFAVSDNFYTWVLLVDSNDTYKLNELVWDCYPPGQSNNEAQKNEAYIRLHSYFHTPFKKSC